MKKLLIPKIAFAVAVIAGIFSLVTFVKSIMQHRFVGIAALQVIGTALIVGVCGINIYLIKSAPNDDENTACDIPEDKIKSDSAPIQFDDFDSGADADMTSFEDDFDNLEINGKD